MMMDVVEPYLFFTAVENKGLQDDIVPFCGRNGVNCTGTKVIKVPQNPPDGQTSTSLQWLVGGGFNVTETGILYSKLEEMPQSFYQSTQSTSNDIFDSISTMKRITLEEGGHTLWSASSNTNHDDDIKGPIFSAKIDLNEFEVGDQVAVVAYSMVDQTWRNTPKATTYGPNTPPQSHIVNARTNPDWRYESSGKVIQGREWWFSVPITLSVKENGSQIAEMKMRLPYDIDAVKEDFEAELEDAFMEGEELVQSHFILFTVLAFTFIMVLFGFLVNRRKRNSLRRNISFEIVDISNDDEKDDTVDNSLELSERYTIT